MKKFLSTQYSETAFNIATFVLRVVFGLRHACNRFAQALLDANPDFRHRGLCVAIYDEVGIAVSVMPLDTLQ